MICSICSDLIDFLRPAGSKRLLRRRALREEHFFFFGVRLRRRNLTNLFKIYQFSFYCLLLLYIFCSICSDLVDFLRPAGSKRLLRRRALLEEHFLAIDTGGTGSGTPRRSAGSGRTHPPRRWRHPAYRRWCLSHTWDRLSRCV